MREYEENKSINGGKGNEKTGQEHLGGIRISPGSGSGRLGRRLHLLHLCELDFAQGYGWVIPGFMRDAAGGAS